MNEKKKQKPKQIEPDISEFKTIKKGKPFGLLKKREKHIKKLVDNL